MGNGDFGGGEGREGWRVLSGIASIPPRRDVMNEGWDGLGMDGLGWWDDRSVGRFWVWYGGMGTAR